MSDPVNEVKDICEKLSPEYQHILLRYVQLAHAAETVARKSSQPNKAVDCRELSKKQVGEIPLDENDILIDTSTDVVANEEYS